MKTTYWIVLACLLAGAGCAKTEEVTSAKAEKRDIVGYELLGGELVTPPSARADVGTPYQAAADKVLVSVGDNVKKGQVLVELSMPDAKAQVEQARSYVKAAETAYNSAKEKLGVAVRTAQRDLDAARAAEKAARDNMDANLQQLTTARIAAEENLRASQAELDLNLLPYKQQLDDAKQFLKDAQAGIKQAQIRSPITGTVIAINARPGEMLGQDANTPVATIVDLSALQVHANVLPEQMERVEKGTDVVLSFREMKGREYEGKVSRITSLPVAEGSEERGYTAIIEFDNPANALVMPDARVEFAGVMTGEAKDVLSVPVGALDKDESGKPIVRVLEGDKWLARVVEIGLRGIDYVEIKSGVKEGDTVQVRS